MSRNTHDSAAVGCVSGGRDTESRGPVDRVVAWCWNSILTVKTRRRSWFGFQEDQEEAKHHFHHKGPHMRGCSCGQQIRLLINTEAFYKKPQSSLYSLKNLRFFSVCSNMLYIFLKSAVSIKLKTKKKGCHCTEDRTKNPGVDCAQRNVR